MILSAVGLYGILPRIGSFEESMSLLGDADLALVALAAGTALLAVGCSAFIYRTLAVHSIRYSQTLAVQLSGLLVNRILPAGIGGLGLNYLFLRAHRHTVAEATTVVTLNNFIGLSGHIALALGLFLIAPATFSGSSLSLTWVAITIAVVLALVLAGVMIWRQPSGRLRAWKRALRFYAAKPQRLVKALSISLALTLCNVACLWLCSQALDMDLHFLSIFVAFTFGIMVGTATPTPGGLGGTEAALVGAFIAQGVPANLALAVALLFRLVSYWFGLLVGATAVLYMYRNNLLGLKKRK